MRRIVGVLLLSGLWLFSGPGCESLGGLGVTETTLPKAPTRVHLPKAATGTAPTTAATGSMYDAVTQGLRLIYTGAFSTWIRRYCHPEQCTTAGARSALKRYNLPYIRRLSKHCLQGKAKATVKVTRVDKYPDGSRKIFVKCNPKGSPYPFRVKKDKADMGKWKWVTA